MSQSSSLTRVDHHQRMLEMIFGFCTTQVVRTVAGLSIADHLAAGPLTADQIAEREHTSPDITFRLLRACAGLGLTTVDDTGRFGSTEDLETLRSDAPRSLRALSIGATNDAFWLPWMRFAESVRTGHNQAAETLGMDVFSYLEQNPALAIEFSAAMSSFTELWASPLAELIDTRNVRRAVDVGGANGTLLTLLQQANPALQGILFDRPNIAETAKALLAGNGFAERTDVVGGDFFESVPTGDLYLLKNILHDWDDEGAVKILRRCREAMEPGGRVAIIEFVMGDDPHNSFGTLVDLLMHVLADGRERSLKDFDALLHHAGLKRTSVLTVDTPQSVIEAVAQ